MKKRVNKNRLLELEEEIKKMELVPVEYWSLDLKKRLEYWESLTKKEYKKILKKIEEKEQSKIEILKKDKKEKEKIRRSQMWEKERENIKEELKEDIKEIMIKSKGDEIEIIYPDYYLYCENLEDATGLKSGKTGEVLKDITGLSLLEKEILIEELKKHFSKER